MERITKTQKQWIDRRVKAFQEKEANKMELVINEYIGDKLQIILKEYAEVVYEKMQKIAETEEFTKEEFENIVKEVVAEKSNALQHTYRQHIKTEMDQRIKQYLKDLKEKMQEVMQ